MLFGRDSGEFEVLVHQKVFLSGGKKLKSRHIDVKRV